MYQGSLNLNQISRSKGVPCSPFTDRRTGVRYTRRVSAEVTLWIKDWPKIIWKKAGKYFMCYLQTPSLHSELRMCTCRYTTPGWTARGMCIISFRCSSALCINHIATFLYHDTPGTSCIILHNFHMLQKQFVTSLCLLTSVLRHNVM